MAPVSDFFEHVLPGAERTIVAFAGGPQNVFQFGRTLNRINASYVLLRDTSQRYYVDGVLGIGGRDQMIAYLRALPNVTTIGVSSGSYAALLYGQIALVQRMLAISPLTGRDVDDFDPKWHSQIVDPNQPDIPDLRQFFLPGGPVPVTTAFVSDGEATELDRQMATRIAIPHIVTIRGYAHRHLAQGMRDRGMLDKLLAAAPTAS